MDELKDTSGAQNAVPEVIRNLNGGGNAEGGEKAAEAPAENNIVSADTPSGTEPSEIKKGGAKPAIIIFAVLAVIAVGITAFVYLNNPERVVKSAIVKTADVIKNRPYVFNAFSAEECDFLDGNSCSASVSASVNEYTPLPDINGMGAGISVDMDASSKEAAAVVSASYNGADLLSADLYTDNDIIMVAVPALFSQVFQFDTENVFSQLKNSGFYPEELGDEGINDFSLKLFGDDNEIAKNANAEQIEALAKITVDAVKRHTADFDGFAVDRYDDKSIDINGTAKTCRGYAVTVDGQAATDTFFDILSDIAAADEFSEIMKTYLVLEYTDNPELWESYSGPVEYCDAVLADLDGNIEYMRTSVGIDDVSIYLYINDGYIVDAALSTAAKYTMLGLPLFNIDLTAKFNGTQNITDGINAKALLSNGTDNNIYEINESAVSDGGLTENNISLSAVYNDETLYEIALTSSHDQSSGDFDATLTADAEYSDVITLSAEGNITADADKWALTVDSLCLEQSEEKADVSIDFEISALKNSIEKPEGDVLEIFGADSEESADIISSAGDRLYKILGKLR